jgi:hypothetical protein
MGRSVGAIDCHCDTPERSYTKRRGKYADDTDDADDTMAQTTSNDKRPQPKVRRRRVGVPAWCGIVRTEELPTRTTAQNDQRLDQLANERHHQARAKTPQPPQLRFVLRSVPDEIPTNV